MSSTEKIIERQGNILIWYPVIELEKLGIRSYEDINFRINLIDTPGYHQGRSMESWYNDIKQYITKQVRLESLSSS